MQHTTGYYQICIVRGFRTELEAGQFVIQFNGCIQRLMCPSPKDVQAIVQSGPNAGMEKDLFVVKVVSTRRLGDSHVSRINCFCNGYEACLRASR